jgi:hypothetical protein
MTNNVYSINEIIKAAKDTPYRVGVLFDQNGNKAMKGHNVTVKPSKWIETDVKSFLTRSKATPGIYYLHLYQDAGKKTPPDVYPLQVGKLLSDNGNGQPQQLQIIQAPNFKSEQQQNDERVLTYAGALELRTENERLKMQVEQLTKERDELLDELENEAETLSEQPPAKHWIVDLLGGAIPAVEAFLTDRKEQRALEYAKMQMKEQQAQKKKTTEQQAEILLTKSNLFFDELKKIDPEQHAKIELIIEANPEPAAFFNTLQTTHPDVFNELQTFLKA